MTRTWIFVLSLLASLAVVPPAAGGSGERPAVKVGKYGCMFAMDGMLFDTSALVIADGNRYQTQRGSGEFRFVAATSRIQFTSGVLAEMTANNRYVPSGIVKGGLKKPTGPAIVLNPSAAARKKRGNEAVAQYCYWRAQ